jgi:peptidoglycan/xylan/chitin deacetylase (PgdA/CDA1 family)
MIKYHLLVLSIVLLYLIQINFAQDAEGKCGPQSNGDVSCKNGLCCSKFGFCGSTKEHCDNCQSKFGSCNASTTAPSSGKIITTCKTPGTVALTFDDGPFKFTKGLLQMLKKEKVKATFFVNGINFGCIFDSADVLTQMVKDGHQIGSHTWSHPDLATLTKSQIKTEMQRLDIALKKIIGRTPKYMRPPFGSGVDSKLVVDTITSLGFEIVIWDVDSGDASGTSVKNSLKIYEKVSKPKKSHICLNHDPVKTTSQGMAQKAIQILKKKGFKFTTVGECLGETDFKKWYKFNGNPERRDATWKC